MKRIIVTSAILLWALPIFANAHGFIQDGHEGDLRLIDYIELGGITLGSVGLIIYSFRQFKQKDKK